MKQYDALIFDLDGTLWDATEGVAIGWNKGFRVLGIEHSVTADQVRSVCGLPYHECIRTLYPHLNNHNNSHKILEIINKHEEVGVKNNFGDLYDSEFETLTKLSKKYKLFIVSNCEHWYLENFFTHPEVSKLFQDSESHGRTNLSKAENISLIIKRNNLQRALYIGDTEGDRQACLQANVDFAFARYGFGKVLGDVAFDLHHIDDLEKLL